jgi:F-type H+-transporting ATPase subunit b
MFQLLLAADEHATGAAADHGHAAGHAGVLDIANWLPGVTALLVFLIAFVILAWKVWPTITKALDEREEKIRSEIESAEAAREQAKAALAEYQKSLASARDEANRMIVQAKADAKAVAEELKSRNQAELVEMKQRATREIESAKQAAISAIYNEAANLGVSIASKILQREVNEGDQARMIDDSLQELTQAGRS